MTEFSFDKVPLTVPKKVVKKRRRKVRAAKSSRNNIVTKIQASVRVRPISKAEVVKLMAMVIDPNAHSESQLKDRLRKAVECLQIYDHFLSPKPQKKLILRRGRKPFFLTI